MKILKYTPLIYFIFFLFISAITFLLNLNSSNIFIIFVLAFLLFVGAIVYFFIQEKDYKLVYFFTHFSFVFSIYIFNLFIIVSEKSEVQLFEDRGVKWDYRSINEYVNYLRKKHNIHFYSNCSLFTRFRS